VSAPVFLDAVDAAWRKGGVALSLSAEIGEEGARRLERLLSPHLPADQVPLPSDLERSLGSLLLTHRHAFQDPTWIDQGTMFTAICILEAVYRPAWTAETRRLWAEQQERLLARQVEIVSRSLRESLAGRQGFDDLIARLIAHGTTLARAKIADLEADSLFPAFKRPLSEAMLAKVLQRMDEGVTNPPIRWPSISKNDPEMAYRQELLKVLYMRLGSTLRSMAMPTLYDTGLEKNPWWGEMLWGMSATAGTSPVFFQTDGRWPLTIYSSTPLGAVPADPGMAEGAP
jgi:hypothetical protein